MNKERFFPNFQPPLHQHTSKTLFYATLKLEPILKGLLPFPFPFGVCRNTLSANKNANGRKRQSGKEFHLLSSCVLQSGEGKCVFSLLGGLIDRQTLDRIRVIFLVDPRYIVAKEHLTKWTFSWEEELLLFLEIKRPYLIMGWSHVTLAPPQAVLQDQCCYADES